MDETWRSLLANLAIVAVFVAIWTQIPDPADRLRRSLRTAFLSALLALGTIATMSLPIAIRPGVFIDLRATMVVLAAFFGGPVVGVAAWLAAIGYRLWISGVGAPPAVIGISIALITGLGGRLLLRRRAPAIGDVFMLGVATAGASIFGFFLLPAEIRDSLFVEVAPELMVLTLVAVSVAGITIVNDERRRVAARQNELYGAILAALPNPLNVKDMQGRFLAANPATADLLRAKSPSEVIGRTDFDFYPQETAASFKADDDEVAKSGTSFLRRQKATFADGTEVYLGTTKVPFRDNAGNIVGIITHNRDITERTKLEEEYAVTQRRLSEALANMADGLAMFDHEGRLVICNPQYAALFPKTADLRVPGVALETILRAGLARGEETLPKEMRAEDWIADTVAALWVSADSEIQLADGRWLQARVRPSEYGTSLTLLSEITAAKQAEGALQQANAQLDALAKTDGLTGLLNRRAFDEALTREFTRSARSNEPTSVFIVDVDHFKAYNDTYGHPQGDECLKMISTCLRQALKRPADVAARYGGEEFVALLPDTDADGALVLAENFRQAVRGLNIPHGKSSKGRVSVSVGVATTLGSAVESPGLLVKRADQALYEAKAGGRDRTQQSRAEADDTRLRLVAG